jgi:lipopolysaccharide/colanic/teichoic acid biosynthesis glycosyltransferase
MAASFLLAVYLRFYSGWIEVVDLPLWPAYLSYLFFSIAVWTIIETRLPLAASLTVQRTFLGWLWRLIELSVLTLAMVSAGTFFWRDYSFSRYTVGMFWALHLLFATVMGWSLRASWLRRHGPRQIEIWVAGDEVTEADLVDYGEAVGRRVAVKRFLGAADLLRRLERLPGPDGPRELLVALGARQLHLYPAVVPLLADDPSGSGILLPAEGLGAIERRGSLFVVPMESANTSSLEYVVSKRVFDLVLASVGLVVTAPVQLLIALAIWLRLGPPVLLSQQRVGRGGVQFRLLKFRTLPREALDQSDHAWSVEVPNRFSGFLRYTGLDELPQLWNVIRGEMSLVGPRPERPHFVERFQNELPFYSTRHRLQVGITGWAQVNGLRGDTSIARRVEYDLYYLNRWSLGFDVKILAITLVGFVRNVLNFGRAETKARDAGVV